MMRNDGIIDEAEHESVSDVDIIYNINSFGADFLVDGLVSRMDKGDIYRPDFQRQFVWTLPQASRFIESILLGLPIPGIFLYREDDTQKNLIVDGLQRLTTLHAFKKGRLPNSNKFFRLVGVKERFENKSLEELDPSDQRRFNDTAIHATIIQQSFPQKDNSSVFHIFERLNTGGTPLQPQEIRSAIYHGKFQRLLEELNKYENWRNIFGQINKRSKDQELILRFLALLADQGIYAAPMTTFLNNFMEKHRNLNAALSEDFSKAFKRSADIVVAALGSRPFRPIRSLNVAVYDSVMVALATLPSVNADLIARNYANLLRDEAYIAAVSKSTSDQTNVDRRIKIARQYIHANV